MLQYLPSIWQTIRIAVGLAFVGHSIRVNIVARTRRNVTRIWHAVVVAIGCAACDVARIWDAVVVAVWNSATRDIARIRDAVCVAVWRKSTRNIA